MKGTSVKQLIKKHYPEDYERVFRIMKSYLRFVDKIIMRTHDDVRFNEFGTFFQVPTRYLKTDKVYSRWYEYHENKLRLINKKRILDGKPPLNQTKKHRRRVRKVKKIYNDLDNMKFYQP